MSTISQYNPHVLWVAAEWHSEISCPINTKLEQFIFTAFTSTSDIAM